MRSVMAGLPNQSKVSWTGAPSLQPRGGNAGMQVKTRRPPPVKPNASPRRDANRHATARAAAWLELPWIGSGIPVRTPGKEKQASSVAGSGNQLRPKKPASSLLQATSPAEYGVHRSLRLPIVVRGSMATALGKVSDHLKDHFRNPCAPLATVQPLVWMSTDRHAATGTCEIGQGGK